MSRRISSTPEHLEGEGEAEGEGVVSVRQRAAVGSGDGGGAAAGGAHQVAAEERARKLLLLMPLPAAPLPVGRAPTGAAASRSSSDWRRPLAGDTPDELARAFAISVWLMKTSSRYGLLAVSDACAAARPSTTTALLEDASSVAGAGAANMVSRRVDMLLELVLASSTVADASVRRLFELHLPWQSVWPWTDGPDAISSRLRVAK